MQFLTDKNTDFREFDISESMIKISPYACVANNEIETSIIVDVRSLTL